MTFYGRIRIRKILPDPDPRKRSGSNRIRIRNTDPNSIILFKIRICVQNLLGMIRISVQYCAISVQYHFVQILGITQYCAEVDPVLV